MKKNFIVSCLLLMIVSSVFAVPYASMGNINIPDAYVLPHKMIDVGYTNYFVSDGLTYDDASVSAKNDYKYAVITRFGVLNRAEVGLVFTSLKNKDDNNIMYANIKIKLMEETETKPAIAIGAVNLFSGFEEEDMDDFEFQSERQELLANSPFIVISKSIVFVTGIPSMNYLETTFHGGIGSGKYDGLGETVKNLRGMFFGMDVRPSKFFSADLELDAQNINVGFNAHLQNFTLRAGLYEIESMLGVNDRGNRIALNLSYTADQFSDIKAAERRKPITVAPVANNANIRPQKTTQTQNASSGNPLLKELEDLRKRREQAEKELEEIRNLLKD